MKSYILLENVEFYAYHGVFPQENKVGNLYTINLNIGINLESACKSDNLNDTISYALVYNQIKEEMDKPSKLIENVAYRIVTRLKAEYPAIESVELKLSKRNPPMGGKLDAASILLKV